MVLIILAPAVGGVMNGVLAVVWLPAVTLVLG